MNDARRLLLVHAHPDDEVIGTGATMAHYAASGASVTLVTCTRGEHGEIVAPELAYLADGGPDALGKHRETELGTALSALGVRRHHWFGGVGRWWDSGMVGTPENEALHAFARAEPDEAVREMVAVMRRERPQVVVTYDEHGGYGHPDHIQAHRVTMAALDPAADPAFAPELGQPWQVAKTYWTALPRSTVQRLVETIGFDIAEDMPGVGDEEITARIDGRDRTPAKVAALRAHRSQVDLDGGFFAHLVGHPDFGLEHFRLVRGERGPAGASTNGWEDDLFAGLFRR